SGAITVRRLNGELKDNLALDLDAGLEWLARADRPTKVHLAAAKYGPLGEGDVLRITVVSLLKQDEQALLRREVPEDGRVRLPLLSVPVQAAGLTAPQVQAAIVKAYRDSKVLALPIVTVTVERRFSTMGAVARPGIYALQRRDTRLLEALALAGGITRASLRYVYVLRQPAGRAKAETIGIDLAKLRSGDPRQNVVIRNRDVLWVPKVQVGEFYVMGQVRRPGVYALTGRRVTVKMALAAAGGYAGPSRSDTALLVRRQGQEGEKRIPLNLPAILGGEGPPIFLRPDDVIIVGLKPRTRPATQPAGGAKTDAAISDAVLQALRLKEMDLSMRLEDALRKLSPRHRTVVDLDALLKIVRRQIANIRPPAPDAKGDGD
ncbi:hypothetical protein LCGC14_1776030, partial [marine sediment metagenome]